MTFSLLFDLFLLLISPSTGGLPLAAFNLGKVRPYQRGFFCTDDTIRYPYHSSTVTSTVLYTVGFTLPISCVSRSHCRGCLAFQQNTKTPSTKLFHSRVQDEFTVSTSCSIISVAVPSYLLWKPDRHSVFNFTFRLFLFATSVWGAFTTVSPFTCVCEGRGGCPLTNWFRHRFLSIFHVMI